jgi:hypothetical protein
VVSFTARRFTLEEGAPIIHWIVGLMGLRADMSAVEKKETFPLLGINPDRQACSPSLYRLSYPNSYNLLVGIQNID